MKRHYFAAFLTLIPAVLRAQDSGMSPKPFDEKRGGSDKVTVLKHVENNPGPWKAADVELEQERAVPTSISRAS